MGSLLLGCVTYIPFVYLIVQYGNRAAHLTVTQGLVLVFGLLVLSTLVIYYDEDTPKEK